MITTSGRISVSMLMTASGIPRESRRVPGITIPPSPMTRSETTFSQVAPRPEPKYFRLGRACRLRTGTANRIPSALATSPPPQCSAAIGTCPWACTSSAEATRMPGRLKYP